MKILAIIVFAVCVFIAGRASVGQEVIIPRTAVVAITNLEDTPISLNASLIFF